MPEPVTYEQPRLMFFLAGVHIPFINSVTVKPMGPSMAWLRDPNGRPALEEQAEFRSEWNIVFGQALPWGFRTFIRGLMGTIPTFCSVTDPSGTLDNVMGLLAVIAENPEFTRSNQDVTQPLRIQCAQTIWGAI